MRVQSGFLKAKELKFPKLNSTRPTKNIVKACVFNVLRDELKEFEFIEAFGGSASMAVEAISNGAKKAYAIELNKEAFNCAKENAKNLNIDVYNADTFKLLPTLNISKKSILYLDPPFNIRDGFLDIYEKIKDLFENFQSELVIIEHSSKIEIKSEKYSLFKFKKFGNTSLSFFRINY
ncbi:16S rRNA (guanine(966)-N(2))-methyltransferase RsmD [Campylobacter canadensis]|uniref:16S rRNA (guanine(966)-N(2))-methyltransferase RsmD n=1 Tax=Campylobacter canadensis TaxID=449520 RepID=UPI0015542B64|nr:16S rRNA (guanine(966)-N(2))-methyltransferase RsmD [Campylobacter canadensis]MBZ7995305.1 16S rRNA (guanine(966)-N(2))-methyltransferase RsmD [Campylobacter canadensis]MBZ7997005.1 16S rRNA (guanine(966)-N(2))-methyltransferase RsmD [Campylobacter canadensis]MBZ8000677.1 16S rRNA (guanine(966)-N(2))-methyltransferase RsmD [Campylobacter canadensis]MBZ8002483.1 16S rRNA (guanine(966)-N(2))-methyltransferase RsmD [Campylobacter canadensis]MBZ8004634.1 16S rRNA (guanine(966)-N(2))-methyltrans